LNDAECFRDLATRYAQAADRNRADLLDAIMADDVVIEGPGFVLNGRAEVRGFPAMLAHFLYDTTVLGIVAWQITHHGAESVQPADDGGIHFTTVDYALIGVGAVLVLVAVATLRSAMRDQYAWANKTSVDVSSPV
jgi:hypothetical protein